MIDIDENCDTYRYRFDCKCSYGAMASFDKLMDAIDALNYVHNTHRKRCNQIGVTAEIVGTYDGEVVYSQW